MTDEELKECERCGNFFDELNEYDLCPDCEEWVQQEKIAIQDTQNSLLNL